MPFRTDEKKSLALEKMIGIDQQDFETFTDKREAMRAAFRLENSIGSFISREDGLPDDVIDEDFNPWDHITEQEKLDERFVDNVALADNIDEIEAVRRQSKRELKDKQTLAESGAFGFFASMQSAVADPVNLIPIGGTAYKTYKTGGSVLNAALVTGSVAAGSTAAQEAALRYSQIERTYGESATNIAGSFLLGGALGGGIAGLRGFKGLDKEIADTMDFESKIANGVDSVGAARADADVKLKGKAAEALARALPFDPLTRSMASQARSVRRIANRLAENPYAVDGEVVQAVESMAKIHDGKYVTALEGHLSEFKSLRKELNEGVLQRVTRKGMTKKKFNELVSIEIRNPSNDALPHVKRAAEMWKKELYEPIKDELIKQKMLPEDVSVSTAVNYLNRVWNKNKIAAELPNFTQKVSKWLEDQDRALFASVRKLKEDLKTAKGAEKEEIKAKIAKAEFKQDLDLEKQDYEGIAGQIATRIMGTPDGVLPYDYKLGSGSSKGLAGTKLRGPLKERSFNIPDNLIDDFLENDIEVLGGRYLRQTAADLELHRAFDGDIEMKAAQSEIAEEYRGLIEAEKDPKKRLKLQKEFDRAIRDITGMRDRIRGTFDAGADPNSVWGRIARASRDLNYLRFMGGVVASSIPDIARTFMAEGFARTFSNGLKPLVSNMKGFKAAASEAKRYGVGIDNLMGGRSEVMADVADYTKGGTAVERGLRGAAEKFGKINLMDYWTTAMKQLHAVTMQTSIINDLLKGKIDKRLKRLGIDDANAINISKELKKHAKNINGTWISNAKNWDSPELERMWGAALRKESDRVIVMPGQEKPLFMSKELGKTIFQFRTFMFSSTQRVLIAGIQGQDANYIGGLISMIGLGMMAYAFKQWDAGRPLSDNPTDWIFEGIDRSGSLGVIMEANNTLEKMSGQNYGLRKVFGASQPASRFASRHWQEAMMGPTFGSLITTTGKVLGATTQDREWSDSDTRAMRRLLPYQNLMFLRQYFDKIEKGL